jgi:hypothetical protein
MEVRLFDHIEGWCGGLEHRIMEAEQHLEEHLISLEMACSKLEQSREALEKQFDGLKLEVNRANRFFEREKVENQQTVVRIFTILESSQFIPRARVVVESGGV